MPSGKVTNSGSPKVRDVVPMSYSGCQKNVPIEGAFFATTPYAAIIRFGTEL
jgi:hypothetical protein